VFQEKYQHKGGLITFTKCCSLQIHEIKRSEIVTAGSNHRRQDKHMQNPEGKMPLGRSKREGIALK
jgi:hypothetical protein